MLEQAGIPYVRRDYFRERFNRDELIDVLARAGLMPRQALSTRSRTYRESNLAARDLSDDELLDLMLAEPTLLRRPIIIGRGGALVGFNRDDLTRLVDAESS